MSVGHSTYTSPLLRLSPSQRPIQCNSTSSILTPLVIPRPRRSVTRRLTPPSLRSPHLSPSSARLALLIRPPHPARLLVHHQSKHSCTTLHQPARCTSAHRSIAGITLSSAPIQSSRAQNSLPDAALRLPVPFTTSRTVTTVAVHQAFTRRVATITSAPDRTVAHSAAGSVHAADDTASGCEGPCHRQRWWCQCYGQWRSITRLRHIAHVEPAPRSRLFSPLVHASAARSANTAVQFITCVWLTTRSLPH